jgi:hypothetical protein
VVDRGIVTGANIVEIVDERKLDLVGGLRMDRRFRALALKTPLMTDCDGDTGYMHYWSRSRNADIA